MSAAVLQPRHRVTQATVRLSGRQPVRVQPVRLSRGVEPHDHDFFELFVVVSGKGGHHTARGCRPLLEGSATLIAPDETHAIETVDGLVGFNLYFLTEWLLDDIGGLPGMEWIFRYIFLRSHFPAAAAAIPELALSGRGFAGVQRELEELAAETEKTAPSRGFLKACLAKVLVWLSRSEVVAGLPLTPERTEVWQVVEAMEARLAAGESPDAAALAAGLGVSRDHLARIFRRETGRSPMAYFQQRRIQIAARRLLETRQSATDIAHELGFADSAHFSHAFHRRLGLSPRDYRKRFGGTGFGAVEHCRRRERGTDVIGS
ncbi:MAG: AraC family transcriptional regulator [Puniceicoccaceae bacterium]|nr:MAG: AraC family transcriptional regulator [Puniceicoccaceae bacterium]